MSTEQQTPETDYEATLGQTGLWVPTNFARTLERQRDTARAEAKTHKQTIDSVIVASKWDGCDGLAKFIEQIRIEKDEAQQWIDSEPDWKDKYNTQMAAVIADRDAALTDRARFEQGVESLKAQLDEARFNYEGRKASEEGSVAECNRLLFEVARLTKERDEFQAELQKVCDHDWQHIDDSFDHEFGTEQQHSCLCEKCGATKRTGNIWRRSNMNKCTIPPVGWRCTRAAGHSGPCAAIPDNATQTSSTQPIKAMSHYAGCPKNNNLYAVCECERIEMREHTIQLERSNNLASSTDALAALIQDRDEWKSMVEATAKGAEEARAQIRMLEAECERLRKDKDEWKSAFDDMQPSEPKERL